MSRSVTQSATPLIRHLCKLLGYTPDSTPLKTLDQRLARVARQVGFDGDPRSLIPKILAATPQSELRSAVIQAFTIGETWLFRDPNSFRLLEEEVFPRLPGHGPIRIWSAGCSSGEEVYSLVFSASRCLSGPVELLGTDVDASRIASARRGTYRGSAIRSCSPVPALFGRRRGQTLVPHPRPNVTLRFRQHNLALDATPAEGPFDLVLCRNVFIYLTPQARARALSVFTEALTEGGWLLLGPSDLLVDACRLPSGLAPSPLGPSLYRRRVAPAEPSLRAAPALAQTPDRRPRTARSSRASTQAAPSTSATEAPSPAAHARARTARLRALCAQALLNAHELEGAERAALRALDLDPREVSAVATLAEVALARGERTTALSIVRVALEERPHDRLLRRALSRVQSRAD